MTGSRVNGRVDQALVTAAAGETLTLLRRAALDLAEQNGTDPSIQRHFANVANHALDLLDEERP